MKTLKLPITRKQILAALVGAALLSTGSVFAQTDPTNSSSSASAPATQAPDAGKPKKAKGDKKDSKGYLEKMKTELGLTDAQAKEIADLIKEQMDAAKAIKDDTSITDKKAKMKENKEAFSAKINAVLTPEQVAKREEMQKNRKDKKGGAGSPANP